MHVSPYSCNFVEIINGVGIVGGKKWHKLRSSSTGNLSLQDWIVSVHNNTVSLPAPAVAPTGNDFVVSYSIVLVVVVVVSVVISDIV